MIKKIVPVILSKKQYLVIITLSVISSVISAIIIKKFIDKKNVA